MRNFLPHLIHTLRTSARGQAARAGTVAVAIGVLGIGIGVSAAVYTAGYTLVTKAIPFPDADQLVSLRVLGPRGESVRPDEALLRALESEIDGMGVLGTSSKTQKLVSGDVANAYVTGSRVSNGFFAALRIPPSDGRALAVRDWSPQSEPVLVLSERLKNRLFGEAEGVVGRTVQLDGEAHTIVGVVRRGFEYPAGVEFWAPARAGRDDGARSQVIARLAPGSSSDRLQVMATAVVQRFAGETGAERVVVDPLNGAPSAASRMALMLLQATVLILLFAAIANASVLLLARAFERQTEVAIRMALGATRAHIASQRFGESVLVALPAAAVGIGVAHLMLTALRNGVPQSMARGILGWDRLALDASTIAAVIALSAVVVLVLTTAALLFNSRGDVQNNLRTGFMSSATGRSRLAAVTVGGGVALALILILTAGLLTRSLLKLYDADPGFNAQGVLAVDWRIPPTRDGDTDTREFPRALQDRLAGLPGVASMGITSNLPMSRTGWMMSYQITSLGDTVSNRRVSWRPITPTYLSTLGTELRLGRMFSSEDGLTTPRVAIVSEGLARSFGVANPLGQQLSVDGDTWTVVGVAADVHNFGPQRVADRTIYVPVAQYPIQAGSIVLRAEGDMRQLASAVRREFDDAGADDVVVQVRTLEQITNEFHADERLMAWLMATFASMMLLLTAASLFAMVVLAVARRSREFGIRIALGASPALILRSAASAGMKPAIAGAASGILVGAAVARLLSALLYGVRPLDASVFGAAVAGVVAIALLASYLPARAVLHIDPADVLRRN